MNILITGGCGFIGSHLAEALVQRGHRVRVLDNLSTGFECNIAAVRDRVELRCGDIRDARIVEDAMADIEVVFHEAALVSVFQSVEDPVLNHEINLTGTLRVLEGARAAGVRRLIAAGSAAAYGNDPELPKQEDMLPRPESPYAITKVGMEYYWRVYAALYGLETVVLRYFNVYGPRQDPGSMYSGVISRFVEAVTANGTPTVFGDGRQTRDFVSVHDVVQANLLAMECSAPEAGFTANVGTGRETSLLDLLDALRALGKRDFETEFRAARSGDVRHSVADISRARERLGYAPTVTIETGLKELLNHVEGKSAQ